LKKDYENVVAGRDILGTHLIRRNDESALLYEKIKIQQQTLAKGESQFREREEDLDLLRNKINDLLRELKIIRKEVIYLNINIYKY
jgi:septal ring factor EnvC (AmiA/AmiB activator)